jgi:integral membrane sensor domain MASE1
MLFESIDEWLTTKTTWIVRQIELYTPITHKDLFTWISFFALLCAALLGLTAAVYFFTSGNDLLFLTVHTVNTFVMWNITKKLKRMKDTQKISDTLPIAITTRKIPRLTLVVMESFCVTFITLVFLSKFFLSLAFNISDLIAVIYIFAFGFILFLEYMLCTLPPPPGEKERKRIEKETRNMVPSAS